tara:strand:+ start:2077 stop:3567 length:1491 start_codon:yes stop_codon:yes gene_type:complete
MSRTLEFTPLKIFAPAYYTDPNEIISNRTLFRHDFDYFVDYGGRGGGKTVDKVESVVLESTIRPVRVLVARELQNSIEESVKAEIEAKIIELDLLDFFVITKTEIKGLNGSKFIFKGIKNNINNLKSIADVDIVLVEEAENVSKNSWDKLLPSIRPKSGRPIIIVIFNPANELDDTYQRFIVDTPPRTCLTRVNYNHNKYFPEFLEKQRLHALKVLPKKEYDHIWEGKPKGSEGDVIVDLDWVKAARFASRHSEWQKVGSKKVGYDPAGQGKDCHAVAFINGNKIEEIDEWPLSPDLREATRRAVSMVTRNNADELSYDECGGFGDGVSVFVNDITEGKDEEFKGIDVKCEVRPFNAGDAVINPEDEINGTDKQWGEMYVNAKAQVHAIAAQYLYNTYRFIVLGERDIDFSEMLSIDIDDDDKFKKLSKEMTSPLWIKSKTNSKKKVEAKEDMEKRIGQKSPNMSDSIWMALAPLEAKKSTGQMFAPSRHRRGRMR